MGDWITRAFPMSTGGPRKLLWVSLAYIGLATLWVNHARKRRLTEVFEELQKKRGNHQDAVEDDVTLNNSTIVYTDPQKEQLGMENASLVIHVHDTLIVSLVSKMRNAVLVITFCFILSTEISHYLGGHTIFSWILKKMSGWLAAREKHAWAMKLMNISLWWNRIWVFDEMTDPITDCIQKLGNLAAKTNQFQLLRSYSKELAKRNLVCIIVAPELTR